MYKLDITKIKTFVFKRHHEKRKAIQSNIEHGKNILKNKVNK
jgi:hypothetical protein